MNILHTVMNVIQIIPSLKFDHIVFSCQNGKIELKNCKWMEFTSKIDKNDIEFDRGSIGEVATSSPKVAKEEDKVKKKDDDTTKGNGKEAFMQIFGDSGNLDKQIKEKPENKEPSLIAKPMSNPGTVCLNTQGEITNAIDIMRDQSEQSNYVGCIFDGKENDVYIIRNINFNDIDEVKFASVLNTYDTKWMVNDGHTRLKMQSNILKVTFVGKLNLPIPGRTITIRESATRAAKKIFVSKEEQACLVHYKGDISKVLPSKNKKVQIQQVNENMKNAAKFETHEMEANIHTAHHQFANDIDGFVDFEQLNLNYEIQKSILSKTKQEPCTSAPNPQAEEENGPKKKDQIKITKYFPFIVDQIHPKRADANINSSMQIQSNAIDNENAQLNQDIQKPILDENNKKQGITAFKPKAEEKEEPKKINQLDTTKTLLNKNKLFREKLVEDPDSKYQNEGDAGAGINKQILQLHTQNLASSKATQVDQKEDWETDKAANEIERNVQEFANLNKIKTWKSTFSEILGENPIIVKDLKGEKQVEEPDIMFEATPAFKLDKLQTLTNIQAYLIIEEAVSRNALLDADETSIVNPKGGEIYLLHCKNLKTNFLKFDKMQPFGLL